MLTKRSIYLLAVILLVTITRADSGTDTDLQQIMQGLRNDSVLVLDGLLTDDLEAVAKAAERIASHPTIPATQVALVAAELGEEMRVFKQFDTLVHDLSLSIRSSALEKDRNQAITDYQQMIGACLACHAPYRQRVADALALEVVDD